MQLYLIRHSAPHVAAGICYGRSDLSLAVDAAGAAARIAPLLPPGGTVFTSPLRRCRELAERLHPAPRRDARLQEMDFGAWEMRAWTDIQRTALDGWAADPLGYAPPGGESVGQLRARVLDFLGEAARHGHADAVLVTHAGVMKVIVGHARGLPPEQWLGLRFDYEDVLSLTLA